MEKDPRTQAFALARPLTQIARGYSAVDKLTPRELDEQVRALDVAQRRIVETTRHVHDRKFPHYDFILVVNDGDAQRLRRAPGLNGLRGYDIAGRSGDFILFEARSND